MRGDPFIRYKVDNIHLKFHECQQQYPTTTGNLGKWW